MEFAIDFELQLFLYSVLFGVVCSIIYDCFRVLRILFKTGKWVVFLEDALFWLIVTTLSFLFLFVANNGQVRMYIFLAAGLGSTAYFFTLSKLLIRFFQRVGKILQKWGQWFHGTWVAPLQKAGNKMGNYGKCMAKKIKNTAKKTKNIEKL